MEFIKLFQNHSEYDAFVSGDTMMKPNVSHCIQENEVHYNPFIDPFNGYEYVDLGLPSGTLWAKMNVGANSPTDTGLYFAWGETQGYTASQVGTDKNFSWSDYNFGSDSPFTKYDQDGLTNLELTDDAAHVNMGGDWHMPTKEQCEELLNTTYVTNAWVTDYNGSGVNGRLFTSISNGNTMFVPAAGYCRDGGVLNVGSGCYVWASTLSSQSVFYPWYFTFSSSNAFLRSNYYRCYGQSVRGIVGYFLSQIEVAKWNYDNGKESGTDGGYTITLSEPIDSNATNVRLCVTSNMENGGYYERPLTNMFGPNWFAHSPRITCSDLDIKYELNGKTYLISGWNISCIE